MMALVLVVAMLGSMAVTMVGVAGLLEKLPPNPWAGIRTPYTHASPENWYRTHRAAAPAFIWGGVAGTMAALAFLPFAAAGKLGGALVAGVSIAIVGVILASVIGGWRYGMKVAKRTT